MSASDEEERHAHPEAKAALAARAESIQRPPQALPAVILAAEQSRLRGASVQIPKPTDADRERFRALVPDEPGVEPNRCSAIAAPS